MMSPEVKKESGVSLQSIGNVSWITFRSIPINREKVIGITLCSIPINRKGIGNIPSDQYNLALKVTVSVSYQFFVSMNI